MQIGRFKVEGAIDEETRCKHYNAACDIIAMKFYCCGEYFPCYLCHKEYGCGGNEVWPAGRFSEKAVLCGSCKSELTIREYLNCGSSCPFCKAKFNDGCRLHHHLYFDKKV